MPNRNNIAILLIALLLAALSGAAAQQNDRGMGVFGNPDQINYDLRAANGLVRSGDYIHAINFLNQMVGTYGDDPRITELLKQAYKAGKMYPQLEELIRGNLGREPRNPILLCDLGEVRFLQNDEAGADSLWRRALEAGRSDEMTYRYVADAQLRYGLYDAAVAIYLDGRRNLNRNMLFSAELASIYEAQRDYVRAIDEYIIQLAEAPDRIGLVSTRIRGLAEDADNSEDIVKTLSARIKEAPGRPELYEILGDLYIKLGKMDKALDCFRTIGSRLNDDGQSLIRFATRAYESKAYTTAISAVDDYFEISKKKGFADVALLTKAHAQLAAGRYDEALGNFRSLAAGATDPRIRDEAGFSSGLILAERRGQCDSALAAWASMLGSAQDPVMANRARVEMAVCDIKADNFATAAELLSRVAGSNVRDASAERALFLLGEVGFYTGDFKKADEIFREMVRQFPTAAYSNDALMRIDVIMLAGEDSTNASYLTPFAEAMKARLTGHADRAAEILSDSLFAGSPIAEQALFYAGMSYSEGGNGELAVGSLRAYIDKYPDGLYTDRAYLEIGDLFGLLPETQSDARAAYNKVLELYPNGPVTEIARERLRQITAPGKVG